jgi:hypothetical protein
MRTLYIVDIEPLDNRYTKQWQTYFPQIAEKHLGDVFAVENISGSAEGYDAPQAGAFFNFAGTCEYKATQAAKIARMFGDGTVKKGDYFLFTDAWNQTVHFVKYMSELTGIKVYTGGIWHAGWYDPTDILGATIENKSWARAMEVSMYYALDQNFFGTQHNLDLFLKTLDLKNTESRERRCFSPGVYPLEWIKNLRNNRPKKDIVVFPHRLNYDKAPWIFDELQQEVQRTHPEIQFIKTQERNLSKEAYYDLLKECKVIFSANKHENLGIGTFEAMSAGCLPIVPNKLSYREIYAPPFKYEVDEDFYSNFAIFKPALASMIIDFVENYDNYRIHLETQLDRIQSTFFSGDKMFKDIRDFIDK